MSLRIFVKVGIVAMVLFAFVGIVVAANDTITLYSDADMKEAQAIWDGAGTGLIVAFFALSIKYAIPLVGVLLVAAIIVSRLANSAGGYKWAMQGLFIIIAVLLVWQIFIAVVTTMTPDISSIKFK